MAAARARTIDAIAVVKFDRRGLSMAAIARKLELGYGSVYRVVAGSVKAPA
jgi:transposase